MKHPLSEHNIIFKKSYENNMHITDKMLWNSTDQKRLTCKSGKKVHDPWKKLILKMIFHAE